MQHTVDTHTQARTHTHVPQAIPGGSVIKNTHRGEFDHWVGKVPWRRAWQPTLVLAWRITWIKEPGGHSPWGHKELNSTE